MSGVTAGPGVRSAFDKFVTTDPAKNLDSFIAYGIYKQLKREWVENKSEELGRALTQAEFDEYKSFLTPKYVSSILNDASDVLKIYAASVINRETPNILLRHAPPKESFWKEVGAGVVAALLWTLAVIVMTVIVHLIEPDALSIALKIFRPVSGH